MSDLAELREALERYERWIEDAPELQALCDAARAYADLVENGRRVNWCQTHGAACHPPRPNTDLRCDVWVVAGLDGALLNDPCHVVSELLVKETS